MHTLVVVGNIALDGVVQSLAARRGHTIRFNLGGSASQRLTNAKPDVE